MTLTDQVISIEQAKRLKELGVKGESFFQWMEALDPSDDEWVPALFYPTPTGEYDYMMCDPTPFDVDDDGAVETRGGWDAYTVAELGAMLPHGFHSGNGAHSLDIKWCDQLEESTGFLPNVPELAMVASEAYVRGAMLIHLLETNLITAEEVNARLK